MTLSSLIEERHCADCGCITKHKIEVGHNEKQLKLGFIKLTEEVTTCLVCYKTSGHVLDKQIIRNEEA